MEEHATALLDGIVSAVPHWVVRSVRRFLADAVAAAEEAGRQAAQDVEAQLRRLLEADVDEQRTTPLAIVRAAVRYPTEVLRSAGLPPVPRDEFKERAFPDDDYDLTPASLADVDPALVDPGIAWGAWKAMAHKARRGG